MFINNTFLFIIYLINGKYILINRLKVQQVKDQDIIKYTFYVEDVVEKLIIFKIQDVVHVDLVHLVKQEDMTVGDVKLEVEKVKELEE